MIRLIRKREKAFDEIAEKEGIGFAGLIRNNSPANMYILCKMKISEVGDMINSRGVLYTDFESALPHYKSRGISNESNTYVILNFIS